MTRTQRQYPMVYCGWMEIASSTRRVEALTLDPEATHVCFATHGQPAQQGKGSGAVAQVPPTTQRDADQMRSRC